jgi:hypothetical protein
MAATRVLVPEATMDEHQRPIFLEDHVWGAGEPPDVNSEAKASGMEVSTNEKLGLRLPAPNPAHDPASHLGCN